MTADRDNNIPASSITYTTIPPHRRGGGAEDVLKKGQYRFSTFLGSFVLISANVLI